MKFKEYVLGEIVDIRSSKRIYYKDYVDNGVPFYRSKEIIQKSKGLNIDNPLYISLEKFDEVKNKYGVPKSNDILLTSVGTIGIPYLVKDDDQFYFKDGNLTWFSNFSKDIVPRYLLYWFQSKVGKKAIDNIVIGSTQKALTMVQLKKVQIELPSIDVQEKIVSIIDSLDSKIELNNQMIATLEELAATLFKRWFVDFEFPDKNGDPYKSSGGKMVASELGEVPEGWEVSQLKNIATIIMGQSPKGTSYNTEGNGLPLINGASDFKNGIITPQKYTTEPKKITQSKDFIFGVRATIGGTVEVGKEYAIGRGAGIARAKEVELREYLFLIMNKLFNFFSETATGSVYINISRKDFEDYEFVRPSSDIIDSFHKLMEPIFIETRNKREENKYLVEIRDVLLPKLLSGELEV
ncbi:restriction endonuclease subunit S [Enterococcus sp. SMC-9]|uniref:restriction endonuclease subunit S n=1 Tax=Enterococcus sp. SMC-9 TaxID=2862343 RepID=UPI001E5B0A10|nr:restriction endonuclease subunit S [Enterococcus sp. SMC-9]MCD1023982.1 restriction endonuclease subunit S [Enterococcus sp. SMC-9]